MNEIMKIIFWDANKNKRLEVLKSQILLTRLQYSPRVHWQCTLSVFVLSKKITAFYELAAELLIGLHNIENKLCCNMKRTVEFLCWWHRMTEKRSLYSLVSVWIRLLSCLNPVTFIPHTGNVITCQRSNHKMPLCNTSELY